MNRQAWTPINPDGSINPDELRRPADTAEPTTWEARIFAGAVHMWDSGHHAAVFGVAAFEARHNFRLTLADIDRATAWFSGPYQGEDRVMWCANEACHRLSWSVRGGIRLRLCRDWPLPNVTVAAGPITTQAEADRVLSALLSVKAARREAVFAPTEAINLARWIARHACCGSCGHVDASPRLDSEERPLDACVQCGSSLIITWGDRQTKRWASGERYANNGPGPEDDGPQIDAVRVRGGDTPMHPAWVRSLRDQARDVGVTFSLAWGEWVMRRPDMSDDEPRLRIGESGGNASYLKNSGGEEIWMQRVGASRSGCSLDGVDYPEEA